MNDATISIILAAVGFGLVLLFMAWMIVGGRKDMRNADYHMRCLVGDKEWKVSKAELNAETMPAMGVAIVQLGAVFAIGAMLFGERLQLPHSLVLAMELSSPVGCVVFGLTLLIGRSMRKRAAAMRRRDRESLAR